jgi:hypothetical protein
MTGKAAPVHPRLTPKKTPDIDLIQTFIARNGVTKPTTAQERRAARKEQRDRGLLTASDPSAYRFRPSSETFIHRSAMLSEGFTLDHRPFPLEKLTGYAEEPPKPAPPAPPAPEPIKGYCAHCHKQLPRRVRADALYCSEAHKMAAHRKRKLNEEADKAFKVDLKIAENARRAAGLSDEYSWFADFIRREAERHDIKASFLETPHGVLITEDGSGAALLATSLESVLDHGRYDWRFDVDPDRSLTEHSSRDPKVIEMIDAAMIENTKGACEPEMLGWSIIKREEHIRWTQPSASWPRISTASSRPTL